MPYIESNPLDTNILLLYSEKDEIIVDPEYQRNGDVWNLSKRQLLMDSIINRYDIPKIYFYKHTIQEQELMGKKYSIIDGRQRLEAIWDFIDGKYQLASDFEYLKDVKIQAGGLTYMDLGKKYPKIKLRFDAIPLPIVVVETDDKELIEDLFSRLNEAVPLNAAEKRNAFGGPMAKLITTMSNHKFFRLKVNFSNRRYQHKEVAAKFLFLIYSLSAGKNKIVDTKKKQLDDFVKDYKQSSEEDVVKYSKPTNKILDVMISIFIDKDPLLKAQSVLPVYFLLIKYYIEENKIDKFSRDMLINFRVKLDRNRRKAEAEKPQVEYDLLEFDRLSQQGTNDAGSITTRLEILKSHLKI